MVLDEFFGKKEPKPKQLKNVEAKLSRFDIRNVFGNKVEEIPVVTE
tara:strand:- start:644 stop:781 length:138 start_codon:yes stop_codon:yes gene_type:complete